MTLDKANAEFQLIEDQIAKIDSLQDSLGVELHSFLLYNINQLPDSHPIFKSLQELRETQVFSTSKKVLLSATGEIVLAIILGPTAPLFIPITVKAGVITVNDLIEYYDKRGREGIDEINKLISDLQNLAATAGETLTPLTKILRDANRKVVPKIDKFLSKIRNRLATIGLILEFALIREDIGPGLNKVLDRIRKLP